MRPEKTVAYYLPELRTAGGDPDAYLEPGGHIVPIHQSVLRDVADLLDEQQSKLDHCETQRQGEYQRAEAYKYRMHLLDTKLACEEKMRVSLASRLQEAAELIANAVANHDGGGKCELDAVAAAVWLRDVERQESKS